jgi:suppressor for copper-sensitivity B
MVMRQVTAPLAGRWLVLIALVLCQFASSATSQEFGGFGGFGLPSGDSGEPVEFAASFDIAEGKRTGSLKVTATLSDPWYIYSVTQQAGGPLKTEIEIQGEQCKLTGPFQANQPPKVVTSEVFKGIPIEEHFGSVIWTAPIELSEGVDPATVKLVVVINGQTCIENGSCKPISDQEVEATFAGFLKAPVAATEDAAYRDPDGHVSWRVEVKPASLPPGGKGELILTATPDGDYHLYAMAVEEKETKFRTLLVVDQKADLKMSAPQPEQPPVTEELVPGQPPVSFHKGEVKWRVPFEVPGDAVEGKRILKGMVGFQACDDKSCDQPLAFSFSGEIDISGSSGGGPNSLLALAKVDFVEVADHSQRLEWFKATTPIATVASDGSAVDVAAIPVVTMDVATWISYVGMALLGGFILNFMPCVLPVIGLKIMGFAQKGKQDVHRIEVLDFWFILGILSVLWGLAAITIAANAASSQFNWGEQFTITWFKVTLAMIVFAMALSFLGVWEIPIPGFAQTKKSGELMQQEGAVGAFFKGFFTTLLATPCSGPFLGLVFGACIGQPWWVVLSLFTAIGLGLSSPYIVIAINPRLLFWLPKPGPWMNTLKEIMAFPLLFTVVFLVSTINRDFRIATLALLMVVWLACWLVGKVPGYAPFASQAKAWSASVVMIAASSWAFFNYLGPIDKHIDWQPFSEAKLAQLRSEGKTVLIDFTADWCLTCKLNLASAIETEEVSGLIKENKVVPLLADWTDPSDEIKKKLAELKSASIPLLAIYPPDSPPIVLRDSLFESDVLKALTEAGPSKNDKGSPSSGKQKLEVTPAKL